MRANKAPEKIYLIRNISTSTSLNTTNDCHEKYLQEWYKGREKDADIEYIRVDALIKAVKKWIAQHDERDYFTFGYINRNFDTLVEEVKSYMKGE